MTHHRFPPTAVLASALALAAAAACAPVAPPAAPDAGTTAPQAAATPAATASPAAKPSASTVTRSGVDFGALSIEQGFNYDPAAAEPVGYITALTIAGTPLAADLPVRAPGGANRSVVAVLASASWGGGVADPLAFSAQVSGANRNALMAVGGGGAVRFSYQVWGYDPIARQPYKSSTTDVAAEGTVLDGVLRPGTNVGTDPGLEVATPANFPATLEIGPAAQQQQLLAATGVGKNVVKLWGR